MVFREGQKDDRAEGITSFSEHVCQPKGKNKMPRKIAGSETVKKKLSEAAPKARSSSIGKKSLSDEERRQLIGKKAYFRAQQRGFAPGFELDDWLAAEREIDGENRKSRKIRTPQLS